MWPPYAWIPLPTLRIHKCSHLNRIFYVHKKFDIFSTRIFAFFLYLFRLLLLFVRSKCQRLLNCGTVQTFELFSLQNFPRTRHEIIPCFVFISLNLTRIAHTGWSSGVQRRWLFSCNNGDVICWEIIGVSDWKVRSSKNRKSTAQAKEICKIYHHIITL